MGGGPGVERRRSLYELRRRLRQVGEACGEVRKPKCTQSAGGGITGGSEAERPENVRVHTYTQTRPLSLTTYGVGYSCYDCFSASAALGLRTPCTRRTAPSTGLLATSFGGLHHYQGPNLLFFSNFSLCLRNFPVRCSRNQPHFWERTASVCIKHLCSVFARPPTLFLMHFLLGYFSFLSLSAPLCTIYLDSPEFIQ